MKNQVIGHQVVHRKIAISLSERPIARATCFAALMILSGCAHYLPGVGPSSDEIRDAKQRADVFGIQVVDIDSNVARMLSERRKPRLFSDSLAAPRPVLNIGRGDTLEVSIWEAPPATLFGAGVVDVRAPSLVRTTTLPEQMVDIDGFITVPFAGRIPAAGVSPQAVEAEIVRRLRGKANQPEAIVRIARNASSTVTVVGEVTNSTRVPLTSGGERLLDALAAAGGVRQPINKVTLQVTRGPVHQSLPLDLIIRDPAQNIPLLPGDVLTAMFQPLSFTALGATGKNEEIPFEAQGITLAQALARAGGLVDSRSNPQGVFIFRLEPEKHLNWPRTPVVTTPEGLVPVVYRLDLSAPASFFVMQTFPISSKDVLYVSNAPAAELQKFLNLVFSIAFPVLNTIQVIQNNNN